MAKPNTIVKARVILYDHGRIMLLKQTKNKGGNYTLVGGTVESNEFAVATLIRECREEAGVKLNANDLQLVHTLHKRIRNEHRIGLYFRASRWEGRLRAREKEKFKDARWFDLNELPSSLTPSVKQVLNCYRKGIAYSELDER